MNWADDSRRFASWSVLRPKHYKAYFRRLLYPARLIYSWMTGRIASNDDAVEFLDKLRPLDPGLALNLIVNALKCRREGADPTSLFPARSALPSQVIVCWRLLAS
jgi:hypothetical protein